MFFKKYILGLFFILLAYLMFYIYQHSFVTEQFKTISPRATPTLFPYEELTIPYLRRQNLESKLGEQVIASQNESYTTYLTSYESEELKINALLTIPTGETPAEGWPAIIFIHGYIPPAQYNPFQQYADYVDYIARNGFAVLKIDLRGHAYSEGEAGGGYYSADYVKDTLSAYSALQHSNIINRNKIGLWGHSMAGNIVLRAAAIKPDIPAIVIWAGAVYSYTDLQKYRISDLSYVPPNPSSTPRRQRQRLLEQVGEPDPRNVFWQQFAPTNFLTDLKGAVQIHHAVNDDVVNIGYSRDLNTHLDKTSVPHEFYEYESGGHNISGGSFVQAMERTVQFYKTHLQ